MLFPTSTYLVKHLEGLAQLILMISLLQGKAQREVSWVT
jgi:hypothetical protein